MVRVLVVEDNPELNDTVCSFLEYSGHTVVGCPRAKEARQMFLTDRFDIIVSDIMMPDEDGYEFVESIRDLDSNIPVILMTARDDIASKQKGFRIGVDDYMVKPIDLYELSLRIGALLRRANIAASNRLQVGRFVMDSEERAVYLGDDEINLTKREFAILFKMLSFPKKTFTRTQLLEEFWESDTTTSPRAVDVYMTKLRTKLNGCDDFEIKTVHGLGYKAVIR